MTARIRLRTSGAIRSVDPLLEWQVVFGTDSRSIFLKGKRLVDVAGLEPAAPCLQSRLGKILTAFAGVAYTENQRRSRFSNVPKLYRIGWGEPPYASRGSHLCDSLVGISETVKVVLGYK